MVAREPQRTRVLGRAPVTAPGGEPARQTSESRLYTGAKARRTPTLIKIKRVTFNYNLLRPWGFVRFGVGWPASGRCDSRLTEPPPWRNRKGRGVSTKPDEASTAGRARPEGATDRSAQRAGGATAGSATGCAHGDCRSREHRASRDAEGFAGRCRARKPRFTAGVCHTDYPFKTQ